MVNGCMFKSQCDTRIWIAVVPNPRVSMVEEIPGGLIKVQSHGSSVTVADSWEDVVTRLGLQVVQNSEEGVPVQAPRAPRQPRLDGSRA